MLTLDQNFTLNYTFLRSVSNRQWHYKGCFRGKHSEMLESARTWAPSRTDGEPHLCHFSRPEGRPWLHCSLRFCICRTWPQHKTFRSLMTVCYISVRSMSSPEARRFCSNFSSSPLSPPQTKLLLQPASVLLHMVSSLIVSYIPLTDHLLTPPKIECKQHLMHFVEPSASSILKINPVSLLHMQMGPGAFSLIVCV